MEFKLKSNYKPAGDQPEAIKCLVSGLEKNIDKQTLLGVTGSGKTFTIANVIQQVQMPTLVIAHNKTLAAQLCNEFREFFPDNAVEYFVSYYDYYQPEAYIASSDTYIEKEAQVNEEIDRLRHACTQALLTRNDVIIVASVSAIYGLGSPKKYEKIILHVSVGDKLDRRAILKQLVAMQFERTNTDIRRGTFRMRGPTCDIMPVNEEKIYRLEITEKINEIQQIDPITRKILRTQKDLWLFPAKHYVVESDELKHAFVSIQAELKEQLKYFQKQGKLLEYERLRRRVKYDLELIKNIGYCNGIENYSRYFEGRVHGEPPFTLLDYFIYSSKEKTKQPSNSKGFLTVIDESHVTIPQIRGMYMGDKARKDVLVEHGFRLPSARDNRPLMFEEFESRTGQIIYVSATPAEFELKESTQIVEQIVRPTGLVDPEIFICPITSKKEKRILSQVEDVIQRIQDRIIKKERTLVTTLTKKMAEDLSQYLEEKGISVTYIHSDIKTLKRIEIITELRKGVIDVIVGVNLLREGLDIPEVSLVAILDADKEGFLRSQTSLIQTIGRASRNVNGQVVLYADHMTGSITRAIEETERRRKIQLAYNKKYNITPRTIQKNISNILEEFGIDSSSIRNKKTQRQKGNKNRLSVLDLDLIGDNRTFSEIICEKEKQMRDAAKKLEFELATVLRDEIAELKKREKKKIRKKK